MNLGPFTKKIICLVIIVALALPAMALAKDTDPTGAKLKALKQDPAVKKALGAKDWPDTDWNAICAYELAAVIGIYVWSTRKDVDICKCSEKYSLLQQIPQL